MTTMAPETVSHALRIVATGGAIVAALFAYAVFDEIRVRRRDRGARSARRSGVSPGGPAAAGPA